MRICVFGGGNIAHALCAAIARYEPVGVITRRPSEWADKIAYEQDDMTFVSGQKVIASSDAMLASDAEVVFVALPQFAIESAVDQLISVLPKGAAVVLVPAPARMDVYANKLSAAGLTAVGIQRVPYISRTLEYGRKVRISHDRMVHKLVVSEEDAKNLWSKLLPRWFGGEVVYLSCFKSLAFSNSNPLLHPSRLVVLFKNWQDRFFWENPPFYAGWTSESSELYIAADCELLEVMKRYPEVNLKTDYESVLDHYGVRTAEELTEKIRSIPSFRSILSPMKELDGKWVPDFDSRYFTEDIPFGTKVIQDYARNVGVSTPTIDRFVDFMRTVKEGHASVYSGGLNYSVEENH